MREFFFHRRAAGEPAGNSRGPGVPDLALAGVQDLDELDLLEVAVGGRQLGDEGPGQLALQHSPGCGSTLGQAQLLQGRGVETAHFGETCYLKVINIELLIIYP
jgi:hypothetical protein